MKTKIILISSISLIIFSSVFAACYNSAKKDSAKISTLGNVTPAEPVAASIASVIQNKIPINDYYFGFNTQMIHGPGWLDSKFLNSVKGLNPQNLRYPGGTIANYWDWKKGWFNNSPDLLEQYKKVKPFPITLENFKEGINGTGATPVFVLNMLTSDIKYQLEMLHHAQDIGLLVKFVELGNEFYGKDPAAIKKFPTGKDYAIECNKWIMAIKKEFPEAKCAVVGCGRTDLSANEYAARHSAIPEGRTENWDDLMFANLKGADGVTFHIYIGPGLPGKKQVVGNDGEKNNRAKQSALNETFVNNVESCLGVPFVKLQQMTEYCNTVVPKGMKVWYTEYNLFEKNLVVSGSWTSGLYVSLMSVLFLNVDRTELICNHNITKNARFAAIFIDEDGFENHLESKKTTPYSYSAGGATLSMVGEALKEKNIAQLLDFSNKKSLNTIKKVSYPSLYGFKFSGAGKESVIIFNFDASPVSVDVNKVVSGDFQFKTYSSDPLNEITDHKNLNLNSGKLTGSINLPAYSISIIYQ